MRIFLLSPANCSGERARLLARPQAAFPLALALREGRATLGEIFTFTSGLYFRGKLAYARAFAPPGQILVITPSRGLQPPELPVGLPDLEEFARVDVDLANPTYRLPLERDVASLAGVPGEIVLLGSIATGKYVDVLLDRLGDRLLFPPDFVGRGDLSRGGLLLRASRSGAELPYAPVRGAVRRGKRPPRLPRP